MPTSEVALIALDNRGRSVGQGALIGTGVGLALALAIVVTTDREPDDFGKALGGALTAAVAVTAVPTGALWGVAVGAMNGRRVEYVFRE